MPTAYDVGLALRGGVKGTYDSLGTLDDQVAMSLLGTPVVGAYELAKPLYDIVAGLGGSPSAADLLEAARRADPKSWQQRWLLDLENMSQGVNFFGYPLRGQPAGAPPAAPLQGSSVRYEDRPEVAAGPPAPPGPDPGIFLPAGDPGAVFGAGGARGAYVDPNSLAGYFPPAPTLQGVEVDPAIFQAINDRLEKARPKEPKASGWEDRALAAAVALGLGYFGARGNRLYGGRKPLQALGLGLAQGLGASEGVKARDKATQDAFERETRAYETSRAASDLSQQTYLQGRRDQNVGVGNQNLMLGYQRGTNLGQLQAQVALANAREAAAASRSNSELAIRAALARQPQITVEDGRATIRTYDPERGGFVFKTQTIDQQAAALSDLKRVAEIKKALGVTGSTFGDLPTKVGTAETAGLGDLDTAAVLAVNEAKVRGSSDWIRAREAARSQVEAELGSGELGALAAYMMKPADKDRMIDARAEQILREGFIQNPEGLADYTSGQSLAERRSWENQITRALGR